MANVLAELRRLAAALVERVLPRTCLACGARLGPEGAPLSLCRRCNGKRRLLRPEEHCTICLRPLPRAASGGLRCIRCLGERTGLDRVSAVWRYAPPLDAVVRALKFGRLEPLASALARDADGWIRWCELEPIDLLVPVPMPLVRRMARGFNQADLLARALARRIGRPCRQALIRPTPWARPQARRGALARHPPPMRARLPAELAGRNVLLVDDVVTTGATLRAAATAARRAGALRVCALALAATPLEAAERLA